MSRRGFNPTMRLGLFEDAASLGSDLLLLGDLLSILFRADLVQLARQPGLPRLLDLGRAGRVRYQREPTGTEDWQTIEDVLRTGRGDCEDLACWLAAERRLRDGRRCEPVAVEQPPQVGGARLFHIIVRHADGTTEDPSRALGMKG